MEGWLLEVARQLAGRMVRPRITTTVPMSLPWYSLLLLRS